MFRSIPRKIPTFKTKKVYMKYIWPQKTPHDLPWLGEKNIQNKSKLAKKYESDWKLTVTILGIERNYYVIGSPDKWGSNESTNEGVLRIDSRDGKVECFYQMVIWSEFRMGQYRDDDHREDAFHFTISCRVRRILRINSPFITEQIKRRFCSWINKSHFFNFFFRNNSIMIFIPFKKIQILFGHPKPAFNRSTRWI